MQTQDANQEVADVIEATKTLYNMSGTIRKPKPPIQEAHGEILISKIIDSVKFDRYDEHILKKATANIIKNGQTEVVTVKCASCGRYTVVAGRYVLRAMKNLGKESVICKILNPTANVKKVLGIS